MIVGHLVRIRPIERADLGFLAQLANEPSVRRAVVGFSLPIAAAQQDAWFDEALHDSSTTRLQVEGLENGEPLGMAGIWSIDWRNGQGEVGLKLAPSASGRGVGTDVVRLVSAWAVMDLGLRRLAAPILSTNSASLGLFRDKCGFVVEGRDREAILREGEWVDLVRTAALRSDLEKQVWFADYCAALTTSR